MKDNWFVVVEKYELENRKVKVSDFSRMFWTVRIRMHEKSINFQSFCPQDAERSYLRFRWEKYSQEF